MDNCANTIAKYKEAFKRTNNNDIKMMYEIANNLYGLLFMQYDYCISTNDIRQQYRICQLIDEEVLQKLPKAIMATKSHKLEIKLFELNKKFLALSARRVLRNFALYIETGKNKKVWDKTMDTMRCCFDYADKFATSDTLNLMRVSCMPGLGKSYLGNLIVAQLCGNDSNATILRITYSEDLVKSTTNQTKSIICSKEYAEIFPRFQGVKRIFKVDTNDSFILFDCEDNTQFYAVTRDGQASGKRAKWVIIDDLLKGQIESNNVSLHKEHVERYYSDWSTRADDDKQKTLLLGTMWADTDLLNVMYDKAISSGNVVRDSFYEWVEYALDNTACFIRIPALDKNGKSTCPKRFSTEYLKKIRDSLTEFLWRAVYQQDPIAPEGLEFNKSVLSYYDIKPTIEMSEARYASLDPARKGKNYVSMPITYRIEDKYKIVDWLYKKKDMKELYDPIVDKIIEHRINMLVLENNTDTSLKTVIEDRLFAKGYKSCTIIEKYSTQNKEQRIKDNQSTIRNEIEFPKEGTYSPSSDMGVAIDNVTSFSFSYPNKFDDGIDSLAMLAMEFINDYLKFPSVGTFDRSFL